MALLKKLLINSLVAGLAFALALGGAELLIRVAGIWHIPSAQPDWYRPAAEPGVPYVLKSNLDVNWGLGRVKGNSIGLRDEREPGAPKPGLRILAIGDSLTFSFGVDQNDTFPRWMERLHADAGAAAAGPPLQVINAGMNGYNLADAASLLPTLLERYQPDLVIWLTITNDYDDSLSVQPNGELSSLNQVASATSLWRWGYRWDGQIDADDFRNSMTPEARATLDPSRQAPQKSRVRLWLAQRSVLAAMAEQALARGKRGDMVNPQRGNQLAYTQFHQSSKGAVPFPEHNAIFYLPRHVGRGTEAIRAAQAITRAKGVPLMLVNAALPVDDEVRASGAGYRYYDLTTLLRQPFNTIQHESNLGWDPHLNARGNRRLASAMLDGAACAKLLRSSNWQADCGMVGEWDALSPGYWADYAQQRGRWKAGLARSIDFSKPAGVHQIAGGIAMDRQFPPAQPYAQRAALILNGATGPQLAIDADSPQPTRLDLQIRRGDAVMRTTISFDGKQTRQLADLSPLSRQGAEHVLEVELHCTDAAACLPLRLIRLGAPAGAAQ